jgi:cytochrome c biogenesis protein CcdA
MVLTSTVPAWVSSLKWIGGLLAILLLIHFLAAFLESKGWIYYRKPGPRGYGTALSNAMSEFEALVNPAAQHQIEERRHEEGTRQVVPDGED